jgi:hypothetical protein
MSRTVISVTPTVDPWPVVDAWAATHKFKVQAFGEWGRTYTDGDGFWKPVVKVQIEPAGHALVVSAWVPFWGSGPEFSVHNIDLMQYFPRKKAQKMVNELLRGLGAPTL